VTQGAGDIAALARRLAQPGALEVSA
jgi:hypothetical protein